LGETLNLTKLVGRLEQTVESPVEGE